MRLDYHTIITKYRDHDIIIAIIQVKRGDRVKERPCLPLLRILACMACILFSLSLTVSAATLVYVPLDDRPVCLRDPVETLQAAGMKIVTPPRFLLSGRDRAGDPDGLWQWLQEAAKGADAAVVSADALLYGGLVSSRTHLIPDRLLQQRVENFQQLRRQNPRLRLYGFSTVMRSPQGSAGGTDPAYIETRGWQIYRYGALLDRQEQLGLSGKEEQEMEELIQLLPAEILTDWNGRRAKNHRLNLMLLQRTREGLFDYFILGRDDNGPYSQTQRELRHLRREAADLSSRVFATFSGADQLGMVLLTRAVNRLTFQVPLIAVQYAEGSGEQTIPSYQGEPVGVSALDHIVAAGGLPVRDPARANLVLLINTPPNGRTPEAGAGGNIVRPTVALRQFVAMVEQQINLGKRVAIADVAFANGSDNSLMQLLAQRDLLNRIHAYSGWNTASNSLGFALSQGILSARMSGQDKDKLLTVRLLDDWAYQANVRSLMLREVLAPFPQSAVSLGILKPAVEARTTAELKKFAADRFGSFPLRLFQASHPWNRMFEVRIDVFNAYPLHPWD
ncbi:hypothetical protein ALO_02586 [Acetonema longum DSM 6540]|uniref:DUF4127 family protein n=1 Tax=Acetonema longum DSM 6540 TaxID=1009370 RepID=F7NEQ2_9FIRM|nr:hypothetical protein ALO_02586 [Acetonema longum DSM 6540]